MARIEERLARIPVLRSGLHDQMAAAHSDQDRLAELVAAETALDVENAALEERWLELAEQLET